MRLDLRQWWNKIYDIWLIDGDLKILEYLRKIESYLEKGRVKSEQETINLIRQIEALIQHKYTGKYVCLRKNGKFPLNAIMNEMKIKGSEIKLPLLDDINSITEFLKNSNGISIKPQNTPFPNHPCWILWVYIYNRDISKYLWLYREKFIDYLNINDFYKAARVFYYAYNIKIRKENLPLLEPSIIRSTMG